MGSSPQFGGKLLRSFRLSARLTQKDLAEKARISVQTIVRIEEESVLYPHKNTIQQLAYALELSDHERTSLFQAFRLSQKNLMEQLNSGPKAELIGNEVTTSNKQFDYDVALSFAGEDRSH